MTGSARLSTSWSGLPGAGRTTRALELENVHGVVRLTPDEWMIPLFGDSNAGGKRDVVEGRFVWLAERLLRAGCSVVLDFGVWSRRNRTSASSRPCGPTRRRLGTRRGGPGWPGAGPPRWADLTRTAWALAPVGWAYPHARAGDGPHALGDVDRW